MKDLPIDRLPVSVVIPTLNAAGSLAGAVGPVGPYVQEVLVADGGSGDGTAEEAVQLGATVIHAPRGRGQQLRAGAAAASGAWLLFLHADTRLGGAWREEARRFMATPGSEAKAAAFAFRLDDDGGTARRLERLVAWRCRVFGLPYGDQGLLIRRSLYDALGGFKPIPLMEDVDLIRRIGRRNVVMLDAPALTSAERFRRDGYWRRPARNLGLLALYWLGVPTRLLVKAYG